jgi:hypothetical protein
MYVEQHRLAKSSFSRLDLVHDLSLSAAVADVNGKAFDDFLLEFVCF